MKAVKTLFNNISDRVAALGNGNTGTTNDANAGTAAASYGDDHNYYLDRGTEPPRFGQYRLARARHKVGDMKTYQDVWDTITQDELDYYLKSKLREAPEQRYERVRREPWMHETGWSTRGLNGYDGYGCNHFTGCIPECRYYHNYGRIEDEEVISQHNEWVESYRQRNAIVEPSTLLSLLSPLEQQQPYFQEHYDERDMP